MFWSTRGVEQRRYVEPLCIMCFYSFPISWLSPAQPLATKGHDLPSLTLSTPSRVPSIALPHNPATRSSNPSLTPLQSTAYTFRKLSSSSRFHLSFSRSCSPGTATRSVIPTTGPPGADTALLRMSACCRKSAAWRKRVRSCTASERYRSVVVSVTPPSCARSVVRARGDREGAHEACCEAHWAVVVGVCRGWLVHERRLWCV